MFRDRVLNTEKVSPLPWVMKEGKGAIRGVLGTAYVPIFITETDDTGPLTSLPANSLSKYAVTKITTDSFTSHDAIIKTTTSRLRKGRAWPSWEGRPCWGPWRGRRPGLSSS